MTNDVLKMKELSYSNPTDPAVNPTIQKKENSRRSLGREFKIKLSWVI